jgi:hypothetical protein
VPPPPPIEKEEPPGVPPPDEPPPPIDKEEPPELPWPPSPEDVPGELSGQARRNLGKGAAAALALRAQRARELLRRRGAGGTGRDLIFPPSPPVPPPT